MDELKALLGFDAGYGVIKCKRVEWSTVESAMNRAILEAAADRHCRKTCDERGYRDSEYHCRICPDRRAILEPRTKEKS